ncbi:MAG: peptidoglycan DD-metalloendopeptidase family protein [Alphaproteobacteria bacterium]|nr:peptidoglycan DD-metalloendopeptidase family protein [Alphaproteobacteria bacterium]
MKRILCFVWIVVLYGPAVAAESVGVDLVATTKQLQDLEDSLTKTEAVLLDLVQREHLLLERAMIQQHRMMATLRNLKHWTEYSPILILLSYFSLQDVVHCSLLLQALSPVLQDQKKYALDFAKTIDTIRQTIKGEEKHIFETKCRYQALLMDQSRLFEKKYALTGHTIQPENNTQSLTIEKAIETILKPLPGKIPQPTNRDQKSLVLQLPAVGEIAPPQQGKDLSLKITTRSEAQVVSPWHGSVVYSGMIKEYGQTVILQQDDFLVILGNLGSICCHPGDTLLPGEPIGCAVQTDPAAAKPDLRVELRLGWQQLDPRPYLASGSKK